MPPVQTKDSKGVNTLLHTLRGEQFRHLQNVNNSRAHLSTSRNYNMPALPIRLANTESYSSDPEPAASTSRDVPRTSWSGPAPPKSWRPIRPSYSHGTPQWRADALQIVFSSLGGGDRSLSDVDPSGVPPLSLLCLQLILASYTASNNSEFREEIVPYIPNHLRRGLIRHCAVHAPLSSWKLEALYEPDGHADGEILVVGPIAALRDDHFTLMAENHQAVSGQSVSTGNHGHPEAEEWTWEEDDYAYRPLQTVALLSTSLSTPTFLTLPASLTYLALINISTPLPIHRLPKLCPLLVIVDISFNAWLREEDSEGQRSLERTEWARWGDLKVVGLRDCFVSEDILQRINKGRWDDIEVIQ